MCTNLPVICTVTAVVVVLVHIIHHRSLSHCQMPPVSMDLHRAVHPLHPLRIHSYMLTCTAAHCPSKNSLLHTHLADSHTQGRWAVLGKPETEPWFWVVDHRYRFFHTHMLLHLEGLVLVQRLVSISEAGRHSGAGADERRHQLAGVSFLGGSSSQPFHSAGHSTMHSCFDRTECPRILWLQLEHFSESSHHCIPAMLDPAVGQHSASSHGMRCASHARRRHWRCHILSDSRLTAEFCAALSPVDYIWCVQQCNGLAECVSHPAQSKRKFPWPW